MHTRRAGTVAWLLMTSLAGSSLAQVQAQTLGPDVMLSLRARLAQLSSLAPAGGAGAAASIVMALAKLSAATGAAAVAGGGGSTEGLCVSLEPSVSGASSPPGGGGSPRRGRGAASASASPRDSRPVSPPGRATGAPASGGSGGAAAGGTQRTGPPAPPRQAGGCGGAAPPSSFSRVDGGTSLRQAGVLQWDSLAHARAVVAAAATKQVALTASVDGTVKVGACEWGWGRQWQGQGVSMCLGREWGQQTHSEEAAGLLAQLAIPLAAPTPAPPPPLLPRARLAPPQPSAAPTPTPGPRRCSVPGRTACAPWPAWPRLG